MIGLLTKGWVVMLLLFGMFSPAVAQTLTHQQWKFVGASSMHTATVKISSAETWIMPLNMTLPVDLLDSLYAQGVWHDSLLTQYSKGVVEMPKPVAVVVKERNIIFEEPYQWMGPNGVKYEGCSFILSKSSELNPHDYLELFFLSRVGVFFVNDVVWDGSERQIFHKWENYRLTACDSCPFALHTIATIIAAIEN